MTLLRRLNQVGMHLGDMDYVDDPSAELWKIFAKILTVLYVKKCITFKRVLQ